MTGRFDSPEFDECRRWIEKKREKHVSWELIRNGGKDGVDYLERMLEINHETNDWPEISTSDWLCLAEEMEYYEANQERIEFRGNDGALFDLDQDNYYSVPQNQYSGWQTYIRKLKDQGWKKDSLKNLEEASIGILKRLKSDTSDCGAVKGLVIGHVQSGKTANMEALMEMASDYGWNMFIILSGTIESLRQQTLKRMLHDFNPGGNLTWHVIDNPDKHNPPPQYMDFSPTSKLRYFTVCLKNQKRLKNLIDWIHANKPSHDSMRMLIIDDEADQASISNTVKLSSEEEQVRKGINKLIVSLVNDSHYKPEKSRGQARAINYVMYTATPYANFLNESDEKSLYPKDFIWTLKTPKEYIGPEQIFGSDEPELASEDGLDIKRIVTEEDLQSIKDIYDGISDEPPESLKKSLCWFICSVAVMRFWDYKKPVSMLVHTSQKQINHAAIAEVISSWVEDHMGDDLFDMCREVYNTETRALTRGDWLLQIGNMGTDTVIRDYPEWYEIEDFVREILSIDMTHIKMDEDGDLHYHRGLHLVIDNCANNGIRNGEDHVRLAYPAADSPDRPDYATAFIVVGGSTLSRGLTIEGLVSTFFLRASCQADTLMQMGRWFGYRRGYELLPRIWMTNDTVDKFRFLSRLETDLRADLKKYMLEGVKPSEYGPRLLATPKVSWLRLTSKKHMTNAEEAEMDYAGARPQTYIFDRNKDIQERNIALTERFIDSLPGEPVQSEDKNCIFWRGVSLQKITGFLTGGFSFSGRTQVFDEIGTFCDWLKSIPAGNSLDDWSVIIAGKDDARPGFGNPDFVWNIRNWQVGKVNRSERRKNRDEVRNYIDIGALRSLKDGLADVPEGNRQGITVTRQEHVDEIRRRAHMDLVPQLIIYRIDKNSRPRKDLVPNPNATTYRVPLNLESDIIGLYITVPGDQVNTNFVKKLTVRMPARRTLEDDYED